MMIRHLRLKKQLLLYSFALVSSFTFCQSLVSGTFDSLAYFFGRRVYSSTGQAQNYILNKGLVNRLKILVAQTSSPFIQIEFNALEKKFNTLESNLKSSWADFEKSILEIFTMAIAHRVEDPEGYLQLQEFFKSKEVVGCLPVGILRDIIKIEHNLAIPEAFRTFVAQFIASKDLLNRTIGLVKDFERFDQSIACKTFCEGELAGAGTRKLAQLTYCALDWATWFSPCAMLEKPMNFVSDKLSDAAVYALKRPATFVAKKAGSLAWSSGVNVYKFASSYSQAKEKSLEKRRLFHERVARSKQSKKLSKKPVSQSPKSEVIDQEVDETTYADDKLPTSRSGGPKGPFELGLGNDQIPQEMFDSSEEPTPLTAEQRQAQEEQWKQLMEMFTKGMPGQEGLELGSPEGGQAKSMKNILEQAQEARQKAQNASMMDLMRCKKELAGVLACLTKMIPKINSEDSRLVLDFKDRKPCIALASALGQIIEKVISNSQVADVLLGLKGAVATCSRLSQLMASVKHVPLWVVKDLAAMALATGRRIELCQYRAGIEKKDQGTELFFSQHAVGRKVFPLLGALALKAAINKGLPGRLNPEGVGKIYDGKQGDENMTWAQWSQCWHKNKSVWSFDLANGSLQVDPVLSFLSAWENNNPILKNSVRAFIIMNLFRRYMLDTIRNWACCRAKFGTLPANFGLLLYQGFNVPGLLDKYLKLKQTNDRFYFSRRFPAFLSSKLVVPILWQMFWMRQRGSSISEAFTDSSAQLFNMDNPGFALSMMG